MEGEACATDIDYPGAFTSVPNLFHTGPGTSAHTLRRHDLILMPEIICAGEAVIDLFAPTGSSLKDADRFSRAAGGGPANTSVCLARLGREVGLIGRVGADSFGEYLIELISSQGVETTHLRTLEGHFTTTALIASPTPEQQDFTIYRGADNELLSEHLDESYIATAALLCYGSPIFTGNSYQAGLDIVAMARQSGALISFDANLRPRLWSSMEAATTGIMEGVRTCDICKLNEVELEFLSGIKDPEEGLGWVLEQGPTLSAITLGGDGVYFGNAQARGHLPAFEVDEVDTTGCGDAFVAGLSAGVCDALHDGQTPALCTAEKLHEIFRFATAVGALAATATGAMTALPTLKQVEDFLRK